METAAVPAPLTVTFTSRSPVAASAMLVTVPHRDAVVCSRTTSQLRARSGPSFTTLAPARPRNSSPRGPATSWYSGSASGLTSLTAPLAASRT